MSKQFFEEKDKVYCPSQGTKIFTLYSGGGTHPQPLMLYDGDIALGVFNANGCDGEVDVPKLFHATPENKEKLEALYGVAFQKPPTKPTSRDIIQALLNSGQKYVPCYVSSGIVAPNGGSYLDFIVCVHNDGRFYNQLGGGWKYATPFDPKTGQPITEMPV